MPTSVIRSISELRSHLASPRSRALTLGMVPTMGALHAGHERLIAQARQECDHVTVTIFVNPIQFDRPEDFERYPRVLDGDVAVCEQLRVDAVFAPTAHEMYPERLRTTVDVSHLTDYLCGAFRPGHFRGVATVVAKLFNIVQPDRAYFGEKDAQQFAVIRRMVRDLNFPVEIVGVPTVREADGLALSSRNQHLTPDDREVATGLSRALQVAEQRIQLGERDPVRVKEAAMAMLDELPGIRVEYFEIVDVVELQPVRSISGRVIVAGATWVGGTRLIDNVTVESDSTDEAR